MVLAGAGGVDHDHLVKLAEKYFGDMTNHYPRAMPTLEHCRFTGSEVRNIFVDTVNHKMFGDKILLKVVRFTVFIQF